MRHFFNFCPSQPFYSDDIVSSFVTDEHGIVHKMGVSQRVNISSVEYAKEHFPDPQQYNLQNLLDAGVNLQSVASPLSGAPIDVDSTVDSAIDFLSDDNNFKTENK